MNGLKSFFLAAVILVCVVGCGLWEDSGPPPELHDTWLSEMIRMVPSDMGADYLMFANYEAARWKADAPDFKGSDTLIAEGPESVPWTYEMLPTKGMFISYSQSARDVIGLDTLGLDQGIWSPVEGSSKPPFSITVGGLEDQRHIYTRLGEAGFNTTFHYGILLLYFWRDDPPAPKELMEHPMRTNLLELNAIAPIEDRLAVAREVKTLERIIEVHDGKVPGLWDELPWRVLTQSVGDELLGGALIPPEYMVSRTAIGSEFGRSADERLEDWERYTVGSDAWGTLGTLYGAGYRIRRSVWSGKRDHGHVPLRPGQRGAQRGRTEAAMGVGASGFAAICKLGLQVRHPVHRTVLAARNEG